MITKTAFQTFGFIGLGLIGGSIASAIREKLPLSRILVFDADQNTMELALTSGVASETTDSVNEAFAKCDCVFLCAPVSDNARNLALLKELTSDTCLITDVGSVKTHIHKQVEELQLRNRFIGGNPGRKRACRIYQFQVPAFAKCLLHPDSLQRCSGRNRIRLPQPHRIHWFRTPSYGLPEARFHHRCGKSPSACDLRFSGKSH